MTRDPEQHRAERAAHTPSAASGTAANDDEEIDVEGMDGEGDREPLGVEICPDAAWTCKTGELAFVHLIVIGDGLVNGRQPPPRKLYKLIFDPESTCDVIPDDLMRF